MPDPAVKSPAAKIALTVVAVATSLLLYVPLVFVTVTDEAGEVLDGLPNERVQIVEKGVRDACISQEALWYLAMRAIDGINANS